MILLTIHLQQHTSSQRTEVRVDQTLLHLPYRKTKAASGSRSLACQRANALRLKMSAM
jgi:hypothetical protein